MRRLRPGGCAGQQASLDAQAARILERPVPDADGPGRVVLPEKADAAGAPFRQAATERTAHDEIARIVGRGEEAGIAADRDALPFKGRTGTHAACAPDRARRLKSTARRAAKWVKIARWAGCGASFARISMRTLSRG